MYYLNTKALSEDIKNLELTDNDWKNYYLAVTIFLTLSMYVINFAPRVEVTPILVESILITGILIFGVSITFKTHQSSKNEAASYISKMTALSFPIMINFFLLSILLGIILAIAESINPSLKVFEPWVLVVLSVTVQALVFWRLNVHLQYINT